MIGAGQLARMTHQAAIDLDVELRVLAASPDDAAVLAGAPHRLGSAGNLADLEAAAEGADVVTFDHELVASAHLGDMERRGYRLQPTAAALRMGQDKLAGRRALAAGGFPAPAFAPAPNAAAVSDFAAQHGWPLVLKARSGGYDGRGVRVIDGPGQLDEMMAAPAGAPARWLVEQLVEIEAELSVLVVRSSTGEVAAYPPVETTQAAGICTHLVMPSSLPPQLLDEATAMAKTIAEAIGATGVLAVEMFVIGDRLLVNELALRPHNSGHATIEACVTSQFQQHLRAVLGWPLGSPEMKVPAAAMVNLIGPAAAGAAGTDRRDGLLGALAVPGVAVHLYGKEPRPGRKLGHVTAVGDTTWEALALARRAAGCFGPGLR